MLRHAPRIAFVAGSVLALAGCSGWFGHWSSGPAREAWRTAAEKQCLASGAVRANAWIKPLNEVDGPADCGADSPFKVAAFSDGQVALNEASLLNCPMTAAVEQWLDRVVQPHAMAQFGQRIVGLKTLGTYGCRRINHRTIGSMSEHAYMNAIDVAGFLFADGRAITVARDWRSPDPQVAGFLHLVGEQSCQIFNTVIGPEGDAAHQDHLHLDLAMRRSGKRYCKGGSAQPVMSFAPGASDVTGSLPAAPPPGPAAEPDVDEH